MAVPKFENFLFPVLNLFSDKNTHTTNDCLQIVIKDLDLDDIDIKQTVPSGKQTIVSNRVYWALTYLKKSLLIETVERGQYKITKRGIELLETNPGIINRKTLLKYKEFCLFSNQESEALNSNNNNDDDKNDEITPEESIDNIYKKINEQLSDDLLETILDIDPYNFERLVMDVLTKMGYGNSNDNSNIVTKKSGDEGIDGIINQDKLGLDKIYVQAKRWNGNVGRPELQKFAGALSATKSNKGIFIITSNFTKEAIDYVKNLSSYTIILINGKDLTRLMIEYNVGVQTKYSYELKKIDNDYFEML